MSPILIGLVGRANTGKSTVATYLEDEHSFRHVALAEPILDMLCSLFASAGIEAEWAVERRYKELPTALGFSYRHLAQTLGTEWGRALHPDFWLRVADAAVSTALACGDSVVVSDVRFPNEADWILKRGGHLVRVLRRNAVTVRAHESEAHADSIPARLQLLNYGSMETLFEQVERLVEDLEHGASA